MVDSKLQAQLRAKFNPDGSDLRRVQMRMLDMLKYIDKVCREIGVEYWLSSGTCLGAVRHGGFIPWDDDVDIEMMDDDYRKFTTYVKQHPHDEFVFQDHSTDPHYVATFGKMRDLKTKLSVIKKDKFHDKYIYQGCSIDVFPMSLSNSKKIAQLGRYIYGINYVLEAYNFPFPRTLSRVAYYVVQNVISVPFRWVTKLGAKDRIRHKLPNVFVAPRYISDIFPIKRISFEDTALPVPGNYDSYLRKLYGDYDKLPVVEDIHPHTVAVDFLE